MLCLTAWKLCEMILWLGVSENDSTTLVKLIMKKEAGMKIRGMNTSIFLWKPGSLSTKLT